MQTVELDTEGVMQMEQHRFKQKYECWARAYRKPVLSSIIEGTEVEASAIGFFFSKLGEGTV